ncbi:hypothetical protein RJ641_033770 [Dillenia turbinata]|uniref:WRKY19-like zinc finger domain-containing protein n=1 Tax=Dillenia turbinata TaxID=194707 RepID=A0AAN8VMF5_9MAGN
MDRTLQKSDFTVGSTSDASSCLWQFGKAGSEYSTETALQLVSPGCFASNFRNVKGAKRKWTMVTGPIALQSGTSLVLGLGPSCTSHAERGTITACATVSSAKGVDDLSSADLVVDFDLHLGNKCAPVMEKDSVSVLKHQEAEAMPKLDLELSLLTRPAESDVTSITFGCVPTHNDSEAAIQSSAIQIVDEGSTSLRWKRPLMPPLHLLQGTASASKHLSGPILPTSVDQNTVSAVPRNLVACASTVVNQQQRRAANVKTCQFPGCKKGARGASGLCIAHGGGRRCQKAGCQKGAEGRTVYCKAHGGGRRCQHLGCTKSAEGHTDFCIAHGGGRRCSHEGCIRAARGKSGFCIRHGGGKRCQKANCTKSAEGFSGLCIAHGGGRRCQYPGCTKGAQGSTMLCKAHGGGKRCTYLGCTKGAEGSTPFCKGHGGGKRCSFQGGGVCPKSVHGGTLFCVAHGGGKRCAEPGCTKSARGRTAHCVRHGGGKRCHFEGCGKSAQGSTDFCKSHGGGKRCTWGQVGSEFASQVGGPCDKFARGKTGLCAAHLALQDKQIHGGGSIFPTMSCPSNKMKQAMTIKNIPVGAARVAGSSWNPGQWNLLDPTTHGHRPSNMQVALEGSLSAVGVGPSTFQHSLPEGRVHGGSLMAMLKSSIDFGTSSNNQTLSMGSLSEPGKSVPVPCKWL